MSRTQFNKLIISFKDMMALQYVYSYHVNNLLWMEIDVDLLQNDDIQKSRLHATIKMFV